VDWRLDIDSRSGYHSAMTSDAPLTEDKALIEFASRTERDASLEKFIAEGKELELRRVALIQTFLEQRNLLTQKLAQVDEALLKLGHQEPPTSNGNGDRVNRRKVGGKPLAEIGKNILQKHGVLHGSVIEELARMDGFETSMDSKNFQAYLSVAFQRDGGFVNLGRNTWRLKKRPKP